MFEVTRNIITSCVQRSIRIPAYVMGLLRDRYCCGIRPEPSAVAYSAIIELNQLLADIKAGTIADHQYIVLKAMELEQPLADICLQPPLGWAMKTLFDIDSSIVFDGRYDVCEDIGVSNLMNVIRAMRILTHEAIVESLLTIKAASSSNLSPASQATQAQTSARICEQMQLEILASVPQHLGYTTKVDSDYVITDHPSTWPSRAYALLWPVWICGRITGTSSEARTYCIWTLNEIGQRMGIRQAYALASDLRRAEYC